MHQTFWKENYFKLHDVLMLCHGCGVSQFPQLYYNNKYKYQILPRPYVGSYKGDKGNTFLKEKCIVELSTQVKLFLMVSISDMPTINYWHNLKK